MSTRPVHRAEPSAPRPSRRTFITHTATAGLALPAALPRLTRAASANEKLNLAFVGTANRAAASIRRSESENFVAFSDVDEKFLNKAAEAFEVQRTYTDYRRMLDKEQNEIDAVVVGAPDHHHAQASLRAMNLGKHVYCEKPLAHTVEEVRLMSEAAARNDVATQMGTQIHSRNHYRRMVELLRSGAIGPVREIHVWMGGFRSGSRIPDQKDPVPDHLNWDLWLGPAEKRAYHPKIYHPKQWRGWWDFGGGQLADFGCHIFDLAHWALGLRHPRKIKAYSHEPKPERAARSLMVEYDYPAGDHNPPLKLTWYQGGAHVDRVDVRKKFGVPERWRSGLQMLFVGDEGKLISNYGKHILFPEEEFKDFEPPEKTIPESPGHHAEWLRACKGGDSALCSFDYAGPLAESVLLGNVAHRAGNTEITYDAETAKITDHDEANAYITKPYRKGWDIQSVA